MKTVIAKNSGYCFGVKRAIDIVNKSLENKGSNDIYSLGEIIHNNNVVKGLEKKGLKVVKDVESIRNGSMFIIRSHGIPPDIVKALKKQDVKIIDATCPYVKKAQSKARKMADKGYYVIIIGTRSHPEVIGIKENAATKDITVAENPEDIKRLENKKKIGIVLQTTQTMEKFKSIIDPVLEKADRIMIENTICDTTKSRQESTLKIAEETDVVIVVGGKNSANTTHLAEIARKINKNTYHIENYNEIDTEWFKDAKTVGISGGASTPLKDIEDVAKYIESL